jgi:hypothetical protein
LAHWTRHVSARADPLCTPPNSSNPSIRLVGERISYRQALWASVFASSP